MKNCIAILIGLMLTGCTSVAQRDPFADAIEKNGCADTPSRTKVCKYDYTVDGRNIEALSFRPAGDGPFPGVLLIPGHDRTAWNMIPLGASLAAAGFAGIAVSQPGYGRSPGPADYVGPKTLKALTAGYRKLQKESFVDPKRMGIYGYSRGGMAASLLVLEIDDVKAAVLGAGIYDFKIAYDEAPLAGVRANMLAETGMTAAAVRERSSVLRMDRLQCPVLIVHGEKDFNVPVHQALLLRDTLTKLHKNFEIRLFPDKEHAIGPELVPIVVDFFNRRLK